MCDNCSVYEPDKGVREFKFEDIAATILRHESAQVNPYTFGWYRSFLLRHKDTKSKEDLFKYVRDKMRFDRGYHISEIEACEDLYKKGLRVLELFKEKGLKHQPRKTR